MCKQQNIFFAINMLHFRLMLKVGEMEMEFNSLRRHYILTCLFSLNQVDGTLLKRLVKQFLKWQTCKHTTGGCQLYISRPFL